VAGSAELDSVEVSGWRPRIRVGIHTGQPRLIGGDYLGMDVNIAARLAEKSGTGEILVSEATLSDLDRSRTTARRKRAFQFTRIKGVPDEVVVYTVAPATPDRRRILPRWLGPALADRAPWTAGAARVDRSYPSQGQPLGAHPSDFLRPEPPGTLRVRPGTAETSPRSPRPPTTPATTDDRAAPHR